MNLVRVYSLKAEGGEQIARNFRVREFACKDGSDVVIIDILLPWILQNVRDHFVKKYPEKKIRVKITSAYRTTSYNTKIGGASSSMHIYGCAADFVVEGVDAKEVQEYLETVLPNTGGIGKADNYTHVDTRDNKSRWTY